MNFRAKSEDEQRKIMQEILEGDSSISLDIVRPNGEKVSLMLDSGFVMFADHDEKGDVTRFGNIFIDAFSPVTGACAVTAEAVLEDAESLKNLGLTYLLSQDVGISDEIIKTARGVQDEERN